MAEITFEDWCEEHLPLPLSSYNTEIVNAIRHLWGWYQEEEKKVEAFEEVAKAHRRDYNGQIQDVSALARKSTMALWDLAPKEPTGSRIELLPEGQDLSWKKFVHKMQEVIVKVNELEEAMKGRTT